MVAKRVMFSFITTTVRRALHPQLDVVDVVGEAQLANTMLLGRQPNQVSLTCSSMILMRAR